MNGTLDLTRLALLVIDMQHDFVDENGAIPCEGASRVVPKIRELIVEAHRSRIPVIFTQELHRPQRVDFGRELDGNEPLHCIEGSRGAEIVEELAPEKLDYVVPKRRYSGFFGTDMNILLRGLGVDTLYITGAATDVCVYLTAMDAHQFDFKVRIPRDCVSGTSKTAHEATLAAIERLQKGAVTVSTKVIETFRESATGS
jgi:nicotinamidase-related amidase